MIKNKAGKSSDIRPPQKTVGSDGGVPLNMDAINNAAYKKMREDRRNARIWRRTFYWSSMDERVLSKWKMMSDNKCLSRYLAEQILKPVVGRGDRDFTFPLLTDAERESVSNEFISACWKQFREINLSRGSCARFNAVNLSSRSLMRYRGGCRIGCHLSVSLPFPFYEKAANSDKYCPGNFLRIMDST